MQNNCLDDGLLWLYMSRRQLEHQDFIVLGKGTDTFYIAIEILIKIELATLS